MPCVRPEKICGWVLYGRSGVLSCGFEVLYTLVYSSVGDFRCRGVHDGVRCWILGFMSAGVDFIMEPRCLT